MTKEQEQKFDKMLEVLNKVVESTVTQGSIDSEFIKAKKQLDVAREDPLVTAYSDTMKGEAMSGVHNGFKRRNRSSARFGNYNAIVRDYVRAKEALEDISAS